MRPRFHLSFEGRILFQAFLLNALFTLALLGSFGAFAYHKRDAIAEKFLPPQVTATADQEKIVREGREQASAAPSLQDEETNITSIVQKSSPSVVSVLITKEVPVYEQYVENYNPFQDFFGEDFGGFQVPQLRQKGTEKKQVGTGSGFLISSDGLVLTNKHVVADMDASYMVQMSDGDKREVAVLARDPVLDVAILRIKGNGSYPYLSFGDSSTLKPGQRVIAIGNALGEFQNSVSVGVVSGLSRTITAGDNFGAFEQLDQVIQTDAAINPGNSGGPLLDIRGKVIGVNVAVALGSQNVGFALPANLVKGVVDSVKQYGEIVRPYLGVRYTSVTADMKKKNNLSVDYGVLVLRGKDQNELAVIPGSPADKAGIVENDIILEMDGVKLTADKSLGYIIRTKVVGQTMLLKILHKGDIKYVTVKLEKMPKN